MFIKFIVQMLSENRSFFLQTLRLLSVQWGGGHLNKLTRRGMHAKLSWFQSNYTREYRCVKARSRASVFFIYSIVRADATALVDNNHSCERIVAGRSLSLIKHGIIIVVC